MENWSRTGCIIGPEPGLEYPPEQGECTRWRLKLAVALEEMCRQGVKNFFCGAAPGPELWALEFLLEYREAFPQRELALVAVLPYAKYPRCWPEQWRLRCECALAQADEQIVLQQRQSVHWMHNYGYFMAGMSAHVLAVYRGSSSPAAYAAERAKKLRRGSLVILSDFPVESPTK